MITKKYQKGEGLVGAMVGLVLSLITVAAMLMVHKTMAISSLQVNQEMTRDGQVVSSSQIAELEIQQAGYGITNGSASDNLWVDPTGRQITWRYKVNLSDNQTVCGGMRIIPENIGEQKAGLYLMSKVNCSSASQSGLWASNVSKLRQVAAESAFFKNTEGEALALSLTDAVFVKENSSACFPYGHISEGEHPMVSLLIEGNPMFKACLPNL